MTDNPLPEMLWLSLSNLALHIKIMKVKLSSSIDKVLSRALDPPASMLIEVHHLSPEGETSIVHPGLCSYANGRDHSNG
jgi:ATP-dependent RNA helicase DHX29